MKKTTFGFALPTVLLSSIILLVLLMVGVQGVASVRQGLDSQYYTKLAESAADSGVQHLEHCINLSLQAGAELNFASTYRPNAKCDGTADTALSAYVVDTPRFRTTYDAKFEASAATTYRVRVTARTQLLRPSDGSVWKTFSSTQSADASSRLVQSSASYSGFRQVCGVIDLKTWCWGENAFGQLGDGTTSATPVTTPVRVARDAGGLAGRIDTAVAVGHYFACTLSSNEVFCWGQNDRGQLGRGNTLSSTRPVRVDHSTGLGGKNLSSLVASEKTVCVIADGDAYCWGDSRYGQLGINVGVSSYSNTSTAYYRTTPVRVSTIGASVSAGLAVTKIAATADARHICALVQNGDAYCWGGNDNGQLGWQLNNYNDRYVPTRVVRNDEMAGAAVTDIAVGGWVSGSYFVGHTCAVAGGAAYCWGGNDEGQIGVNWSFTGDPGNGYTVPIKVYRNGITTTGIQQVAVGSETSCARSGNRIWCWGGNDEGQLGLGYTSTRELVPREMPNTTNALAGKTITELRAGVWRACVLADGTTYCWGYNGQGQIGDGTLIDRPTPTEAKFLRSKIPIVKF